MRSSYTNKKNETVIVSKEHLETAVELKILLQKDSNSNRCSWAKHKQLMVKEGFDDSENSENYRKLINDYQKSIGKLPSSETYADKVVTSKIEAYKELVGEVKFEKHENQKYLRQINKGKREIADGVLFIEEVRNEINKVFGQVNWKDILDYKFTPVENFGETRMIICLTDWHIGALVDVEGNSYNYEIAKERIHSAIDQAMQVAFDKKVFRIDVIYQGDILEHAYMRNSQSYHAEFPVSKQMALGGRLMIEVLNKLSKHFAVTYRGFAGNHDRINGDKNGNIDGDTGMVVVNELVEMFVENKAKKDNLFYLPTDTFSAQLLDVNGRNFKFVHGDLDSKNDKNKIHKHSSRDKVTYDVFVYGHYHHYGVEEVGVDRYELRVGSTKGSDDYSVKLGLGSSPSQACILVDVDGKIDFIRLGLD